MDLHDQIYIRLSGCTTLKKILADRSYGVATVSGIDKMIGLFCRISSLLLGFFAKETCNFKEPSNRSHPISIVIQTIINHMCVDC